MAISLGELEGVVREMALATFDLGYGVLRSAGWSWKRATDLVATSRDEDEWLRKAQVDGAAICRDRTSYAATVRRQIGFRE